MIKIKLTENYTGFHIEGTYDDFNELYDSIDSFLDSEKSQKELEEDMRLHILGFLYDLRHAYQRDRYVKTEDNRLTEEDKEFHGINKSVKQNIILGFDYLVTDLILDILLFKHFAVKNSNELNEFNPEYNIVNTFYSKVVFALTEIITPVQYKKIKKSLKEAVIHEKYYIRQWFLNIDIDYIRMNKTKRKREIIHIIDAICNWHSYDEYHEMREEIYKYAKDNNCRVTDIEYGEFPEEIEW